MTFFFFIFFVPCIIFEMAMNYCFITKEKGAKEKGPEIQEVVIISRQLLKVDNSLMSPRGARLLR